MRKLLFVTMLVIFSMNINQEVYAMTKTQEFFSGLNVETMDTVYDFYAENVEFYDPMVHVSGVENLKDYYKGVYEASDEVFFEYLTEIQYENELVLVWRMTFNNKKLNKGKDIVVDGTSYIKFNNEGKAVYHRDYFDMGAMIYKHVPVLRGMVKFVNKKLAKSHAKN